MQLQANYPACTLVPEIKNAISPQGMRSANAPAWKPVCKITYSRNSWVKLLQLPSEYSFDEAMLLCQESPETWVAWVPGHGETLLDRSDFYS